MDTADDLVQGSPQREDPPDAFTAAQREGLAARRADRDQTLDAVHRLESALASAARGREGPWLVDVSRALEDLDGATSAEQRNAALPTSLLSDIARTQPRLRSRVRGIRAQYEQVRQRIGALRAELERGEADADVADIRQRLAWLVQALRHQRARESDLIYEAYYEAFARDVEDDLEPRPW